MGLLAVLKFLTYNATFADLGVENEVEWLLLHGGIHGYLSSGFTAIYPIQYQKPVLFLFLPLYAMAPGPETLIIIGTISLGVAALPLYAMARRMLRSEWQAATIAICYLLYFPVASSNLFDFHWEDLFPLFFFFMAWTWSAGSPRWMMYAGAILTATINPLTLIIAVTFLLATALPPPGTEFGWGWVHRGLSTFFSDVWRSVVVLALLVLLEAYSVAGVLFTAGAFPKNVSGGLSGVLLFDINDKLMVILLLLAPFAFVSLYSFRGLIVALPYLGFVLDSVDSANFVPFGLYYTLLGAAPFIFAAVDSLATIPDPPSRPAPSPPQYRRTSPRLATLRTILLVSAVFALIFFPLSPVNSYVAGGYFSGNHNTANLIAFSPATEFLDRAIALVPGSASVLTQNNIPQLSGRTHIQVAPNFLTGAPYNVILMDSELTYFSDPSALIPYINNGLADRTFGIAAEGQGAVLAIQGYAGAPEIYVPTDLNFTGSEMTPFSGIGQVNGSTIQGSGPGYSIWYGPYVTLPPGQYRCTFKLSSNETSSGSEGLVRLEVSENSGSTVLNSTVVTAQNFSGPGVITSFELTFDLGNVTSGVEFRGMFPTGIATITLTSVLVRQTSAL